MPGLFDMIENKRKEAQASRTKEGFGTLKGLAEVIQRRRVEALMKKKAETLPAEEKSNAK